jgi:hypothetical protein
MDVGMAESGWKNLYKVGGTTALVALLVPLAEVAINYLPGGAFASQRTATVVELSLSRQYARATTDPQRSLLIAVGRTMLAEGQSRC